MLGGVQTFFHFQKKYEGHRAVANQYLTFARECERLIALDFDGIIDVEAVSKEMHRINGEYNTINQEAEALTTRGADYEAATKVQERKKVSEPSLVEQERARIQANVNK